MKSKILLFILVGFLAFGLAYGACVSENYCVTQSVTVPPSGCAGPVNLCGTYYPPSCDYPPGTHTCTDCSYSRNVCASVSWSPSSLVTPGSSIVSWSTSNAASVSYSCSGPVPGSGSIGTSGSFTLDFLVTSTTSERCIVTARGASGVSVSASSSVVLYPPPPPSCSISFEVEGANTPNDVSISWSTSNAELDESTFTCSGPIAVSNQALPSLSGTTTSSYPSVSSDTDEVCRIDVENIIGVKRSCSATLDIIYNKANYIVKPGERIKLNVFGSCKIIRNSGSVIYYIPVKTSYEWNLFLSNKPSSISIASC